MFITEHYYDFCAQEEWNNTHFAHFLFTKCSVCVMRQYQQKLSLEIRTHINMLYLENDDGTKNKKKCAERVKFIH